MLKKINCSIRFIMTFCFLFLCREVLALPGWSNYIQITGVGHEGQGADVFFTNLDNNARPEMILMAYDNPSRANSFRYKIGWNVNVDGHAVSWSNFIQVPGVGYEGQGAGIFFINLDNNARPEMILMAYDNPSRANSFRYKIGWNVNADGHATSWNDFIQVPGVGHEGQGAGIFFINLDNNARPEMILMAYDNPSKANSFRYKVGWNVNVDGLAASWSNFVQVPGVGYEGQGAGFTLFDIDNNGMLDMILMAYDNPSGDNSFRYRIGWSTMIVNNFIYTLDTIGHYNFKSPTKVPDSLESQTAENLYQLSDPIVRSTAYEAIMDYVNDCHANPEDHNNEVDNAATITFQDVLMNPDAMIAAIAWFVDQNMRWTADGTNENILNNVYGLNYHPGGGDFPIPANYTITYTGDAAFGSAARFHGDCEDFAILRAALLRALGFHPAYIWNVIDNPISHEYNIVVYQGRFRIMDYGPITRWLATHSWDSHRSYYGYSEAYGSRGFGTSQHNNLVEHANNYPNGAPSCRTWSYLNYYAETCP